MSLVQLLRRLVVLGRKADRPQRTCQRFRPRLEMLEDRLAPTVATWTGKGPDSNWTTAGNWLRNGVAAAPLPGDALNFGAGALLKANSDNNFAAGTLFASLTFADSGYDVFGNSIQLSGGISTSAVTAGFDTISLNGIVLTANQTFNIGNSAPLQIFSAIDDGATPRNLAKAGTGGLVLSGLNTYDGATTVSAGTLEVTNGSALGSTTGGTTVLAGATLAVESLGGLTISERLTLSGAGMSGLGALRDVTFAGAATVDTWAGTIALPGTATVGVDNSHITLKLTGVISGAGGLTKVGDGTLQLGGNLANTYTGATTVNGGTLELNDIAVSGAFAGPLVVGDADAGIEVVRLLQGSEIPSTAVTVNATGVLDLNAHGDDIGPLTLAGGNVTTEAGTLKLNGNVTTLASSVSATISGNLDLNSPTRTFTVAEGASANDLVVSAKLTDGGILKAGAGKMVLQGANTYSGATLINAGTLEAQSNAALGQTSGSTTVAAGATLSVYGFGLTIPENLILNGTGVGGLGALRDISPSLNFNTNTVSGSVLLNSASSMESDIFGEVLALTGIVSGTGALTKIGSGSIWLAGANTYTGLTKIVGGIAEISSNASLGSTSAGTIVASGGALGFDLASADFNVTESLTLNGAGVFGALRHLFGFANVTLSGAITLASTATVSVISGSLALTGVVSGPGGLTIVGNGTMQLGGAAADTFTGPTSVTGGTLELNSSALDGAIHGPLAISSGKVRLLKDNQIANTTPVTLDFSVLDLNGFSDTIGPLTLGRSAVSTAAGVLTLNGNIVCNSTAPSTISGMVNLGSATRTISVISNQDLDISAAISGSGGIIMAGPGALRLSGNNTYSGATTVNAGRLLVDTDTALGSTAAGTTVAPGATLVFEGILQHVAENLVVNGAGDDGQGALRAISLAGAEVVLSGSVRLATTTTIGVDLGISLTFTGVISGAGGLTVVDFGTVQIGGAVANTFTGTTTVNDGVLELNSQFPHGAIIGPLVIGDSEAPTESVRLLLNEQIALTAPVTVNATGTLNLNGHSQTIGPLTLAGGAVTTGAGLLALLGSVTSNTSSTIATISGNVLVSNSPCTITVANGGGLDIDATITGNGINKMGPGVLLLAGNNTHYNGNINVNAGTLVVTSSSALGTNLSSTTVAAGATLSINGDGLNLPENLSLNGTLFNIGGNNQVSGNILLNNSAAYNIVDDTKLTISGVINGAAALTKNGNGALALGNANTYTGATIINAGRLEATNSTGSATGVGQVTVHSGAALGGNGTVGDVLVEAGGTIDPATASIPSANLTVGSITFDTGSIFEVALGVDRLTVTGLLNLAGAKLMVTNSPTPGSYRFIDNLFSTGVVGVFSGLPEGSALSSPIGTITYVGGTGNDVVVSI